jgi:O-antigen ligase
MILKRNSLFERTPVRNKIGEALSSPPLIFVATTLIALVVGILIGIKGPYALAIVVVAGSMGITLLLRQDEWMVIFILVIHLYVDWYLGFSIIAQVITLMVLLSFFISRSSRYPWAHPRALWLWMMYLTFTIFPAIQGALTRYDAAFYYPNIVFGALLMFWLGTVLARDIQHVRRFFTMLAAVGVFLAIITIIQDWTGTLLFSTSHFDTFLVSVSNFNITQGSNVDRLGSFLVNPDWNGAFFAILLCIPLGLFIESDSSLAKLFYLLEALIILPALLFTYSIGAWVSAGVGIIVFIVLADKMNYRVWISTFLVLATLTLSIGFPAQIGLLFQHASNPSVFMLREGAWKTALRVMKAFPLTGVGMGLQTYMVRSDPYRVLEQYRPLAHPHNSFLELGAMAGIPVLVIFVALILFALRQALHNWMLLDGKQRILLGSGIAAVVALSINSLSVNVWTLPPLAAFGWVILGVVSSPLLIEGKKQLGRKTHEYAEAE